MITRRTHPCILTTCGAVALFAASILPAAAAFAPASSTSLTQWRTAAGAIGGSSSSRGVTNLLARSSGWDENEGNHLENSCHHEEVGEGSRRSFLSQSASAAWSAALLSMIPTANNAALADDSESAVESIASRAARLSKTVEDEQKKALEEAEIASPTTTVGSPSGATTASGGNADARTMYGFDLPMKGFDTPMTDVLARSDKVGGDDGGKKQPKVVLFVNIKQDDVVARKNIPELIALASKFGREGDFAVVCSPTDQGYYEVS